MSGLPLDPRAPETWCNSGLCHSEDCRCIPVSHCCGSGALAVKQGPQMKAAAVWLEAAGEFVQRPAVQGGVLFFVPCAAFHCAVHCTLFVLASLLVLSCILPCGVVSITHTTPGAAVLDGVRLACACSTASRQQQWHAMAALAACLFAHNNSSALGADVLRCLGSG